MNPTEVPNTSGKVRHVMGLSGGKDSTALAIYMRGKIPNIEYVFCDTGAELPETYEYLDKLESYLGQKIARLNSDLSFETLLQNYGGYLPSPQARWCTKSMKLIPLERFFGNDTVYSYIAIRADERREGYVSTKPNVIPVFPFKEAGITIGDVQRILDEAGIGLPKYYEWRSRSGCYFCFFQRKEEWVGLLERHPDLFEKSKQMEKILPDGKAYTWVKGRDLSYIEKNKEKIILDAKKRQAEALANKKKTTLFEQFSQKQDDEGCLVCEL